MSVALEVHEDVVGLVEDGVLVLLLSRGDMELWRELVESSGYVVQPEPVLVVGDGFPLRDVDCAAIGGMR